MAIAGGMTTAYQVIVRNGELKISQTTFPSDKCHNVQDAIATVRSGNMATVKGSDVVEFRQAWSKANGSS